VSSILEALRELESRRPPVTQSVVVPAEQPSTVNRAAEVIGIVSIGLVLGALAFLLFMGISGALRAFAARERPAPPTGSASAEAPAPAPARPAWLETADPPRARVERTTPARPEEPARAGAERPVREAKADAAGSSAIEVADIDWSPDTARRVVTLRLDGSVVRLHERQSEQGIEVQSIQPDGVYVRRGADVFMVAPTR